jgi:cell shape-determining protein MreC
MVFGFDLVFWFCSSFRESCSDASKGYQEILLLKERLNPSRIQQKEVRAVEVA